MLDCYDRVDTFRTKVNHKRGFLTVLCRRLLVCRRVELCESVSVPTRLVHATLCRLHDIHHEEKIQSNRVLRNW